MRYRYRKRSYSPKTLRPAQSSRTGSEQNAPRILRLLTLILSVIAISATPIFGGTIDGRVINDTNGNGFLDGGEGFLRDPALGCAGTPVTGLIISWTGPTNGSTSVNLCNTGGPYYHVGNLPAGTYTLTLSVPGGWQPVTATMLSVAVSSTGTAQTSFFIRPIPTANGAIDGRVINDTNGNGVLDGGESFLRDPALGCTGTAVSGLVISWSGPTSGSTSVNLCNAGGPYYHVGNLPAGTYNLTLSVPGGWQPVTATTLSVSVSSSGIAQTSFFIRPIPIANGAIDGRVINDTNGNGVLDGGESFLRDPALGCTGTAVSGLVISWSGPTSGSCAFRPI